jgi:heat shock protein HslJ
MRILLAALLVLAVAGCGRGTGGPAADDRALPTGRTFLSDAVKGHTLVKGSQIRVSFTKDEVRVHAGCNHLMGTARLDGEKLIVTGLGSTEMACDKDLMAQDEWLGRFLTAKPAWRLDGDTLVLTSENTEIRMVDEKVAKPDKPLQGTKWVLDTIIDDTVASSVPAGVTAWITFGKDGVAGGSTGCNSFGSAGDNYQADTETITFGDLVMTKRMCGEAAASVEQAVRDVLRGKVDYTIDGDVLTLTAKAGKALQFRAG